MSRSVVLKNLRKLENLLNEEEDAGKQVYGGMRRGRYGGGLISAPASYGYGGYGGAVIAGGCNMYGGAVIAGGRKPPKRIYGIVGIQEYARPWSAALRRHTKGKSGASTEKLQLLRLWQTNPPADKYGEQMEPLDPAIAAYLAGKIETGLKSLGIAIDKACGPYLPGKAERMPAEPIYVPRPSELNVAAGRRRRRQPAYYY